MRKKSGWLKYLLLAGIVALPFMLLNGCFKSPTNPHDSAFSSVGSGGNGGFGGPTAVPTSPIGVPTSTGPTGSGSISGTISNSGGGLVTISAINTTTLATYQTTRTGDGSYSISSLPNGSFAVEAATQSNSAVYPGFVTVSGSAVTGINLSF